jgi:hypothetical protein
VQSDKETPRGNKQDTVKGDPRKGRRRRREIMRREGWELSLLYTASILR